MSKSPYHIQKKRPFYRQNSIWEDNINADLEELMWEGVDSIKAGKNVWLQKSQAIACRGEQMFSSEEGICPMN
jgi:hypothetical protein